MRKSSEYIRKHDMFGDILHAAEMTHNTGKSKSFQLGANHLLLKLLKRVQ